MDGIIIDSEPYWKEAEIKVYQSVGLVLTEEMCERTTGLGTFEAVNYWYSQIPWSGKTILQICHEIEHQVYQLILQHGQPMKGFLELVQYIKSTGLKIGLASSSPLYLIDAVLNKLDIRKFFDAYSSSEFEEGGKPNPAVYIRTAEKLNVESYECIAFEDSINGMKAALSAGMFTIVMPISQFKNNSEYNKANMKIKSLDEFINSI